MKYVLSFSITCILVVELLYGQQPFGGVVSDFRISADSTPSTFVQKNIRLFPKADSGFVAAWEDDRDGELSYYAQQFDASGNKVGGNYKTTSNEAISFLKDGSSLSIRQTISRWEDYCYNHVQGSFRDSSGDVIDTLLQTSIPSGCSLFDPAIGYYYTNSDDSYYFLSRNYGTLNLWKYDKYGHREEAMIVIATEVESARSASITVQKKDGGYLLTYYRSFINGEDEIYGVFVNSTDSTLAQPHPLGLCVDSSSTRDSYFYFPLIKSCVLQDSIYEVFAIRNDSALLEYRAFHLTGNPLINTMQIPVMINGYDHFTLHDITISTVKQNSVSLMVEGIYSLGNQDDKYTVLLRFDSTGMEVGVPVFTEGWLKNDGGYNISLNDHDYIVASEYGDDVYLKHYHDLTPEDSMKVNDDSLGSNDEKPNVMPAGQEKYFVTWEAGGKYFGQKINLQGEKLGEQRILEGKIVKCFSNDYTANMWSSRIDGQSNLYGFTLYNSAWIAVERETVLVTQSSNDLSTMVSMERLSDSTFVFATTNIGSGASVKLFSSTGELLRERSVQSGHSTIPTLFIHDDTSFWIQCGGYVQRFSNLLDSLSPSYSMPYAELHLEGNNFLAVDRYREVGSGDPFLMVCHGRVVTAGSNITGEAFVIAYYMGECLVFKLTPNKFLAVVQSGSSLYAKSFFNTGLPDRDRIMFHSGTTGLKKNASLALQNGEACFVWAEVRPPGRGYDIFGSVMPISSLLDVPNNDATLLPKEYALYQNYPNPFNPSTTIQYDIPVQGNVNISVFDVLGREVARLVNGIQQAGEHSIEWNAEGVPSGVYFYRVTKNNFTETKKLMLLR